MKKNQIVNAIFLLVIYYPLIFFIIYGKDILLQNNIFSISENSYKVIQNLFTYTFIGLSFLISIFQIYSLKITKQRKIKFENFSYNDNIFILNIITYLIWAYQFNIIALLFFSIGALITFVINKCIQIYYYYEDLPEK